MDRGPHDLERSERAALAEPVERFAESRNLPPLPRNGEGVTQQALALHERGLLTGRDLYDRLRVPTPIERRGDVWAKRDDLFDAYGAPGGKARTCLSILATQATPGGAAVTASSRHSPQAIIVARVAAGLGLLARVHMPAGTTTPEAEAARDSGAQLITHRPGYNSVIVRRAQEDAAGDPTAVEVPFGMECWQAVEQSMNAALCTDLPVGVKRVVVPVGSGMTLAGLLHGLPCKLPVLGVQVGADPTRRLDTYAPAGWRERVTLVQSEHPYHKAVNAHLAGILLDPIYEAKCKPYLEPDDLLWIVGIRANLI